MTRRLDTWDLATFSVLIFSAYLLFANLDHSHLWEDEGATAVVARTFLKTGDIAGWDGRNLIGCAEVRCLNSDGRTVLPPVMFLLTAAGIAVAGDNEVGYRITHAFCGFVSLVLLWILCKRTIPGKPRLHFMVVALVALSPQMLMFFRASRYFAFSTLSFLAAIYAYSRWWDSRQDRWLVALGVISIAAFLNHYAIGASGAISLVLCHFLFRGGETTRSDFAKCALTAGCVVGVCLAYVYWIGVIGEGRWGMSEFATHPEDSPGFAYRAFATLRSVFEAGWISWWILPCFLMLACGEIWKGGASTSWKPATWFLLLALSGILASVFIEELAVQTAALSDGGHLRYIAFTIPALFFVKAFVLDKVFNCSPMFSFTLFGAIILTSVDSFPLKIGPHAAFRFDLINFVKEIHRPYVDGLSQVEEYLATNAEFDDLVHIKNAPMKSEPLIASLGDRIRFCCIVPEGGAQHVKKSVREEWADYVWEGNRADWIVSTIPLPADEVLVDGYALEANLSGWIHFPNPQRPEINWHFWKPPRSISSTMIYRRVPLDAMEYDQI